MVRELPLEDGENRVDAKVPSGVNFGARWALESGKLYVERGYPLRANLVLEKVREPFHPVVHLVLAPGAAEEDAAAGLDDGEECGVVKLFIAVLAFRVFVDPIIYLVDALLDACSHGFGGVFEGVALGDSFGKDFGVSSELLCVVERESLLARPVVMPIVGIGLEGEGKSMTYKIQPFIFHIKIFLL